jgi:hypothetical protein
MFLLAALTACTDGNRFNYEGQKIYDYFPLDGTERSWTYSQDDESIDYFLHVEMVQPTRTVDAIEVVTLETTRSDTKELVATTEWSSDSRNGVLIHSYAVGTEPATSFDPPIVFADSDMAADETIDTETAAGTFSATFVSLEDCPNHWVPGTESEPWTCAHMNLTGPGLGFEGDYWIAPRYGTALFQRIQDPDKWNLLEAIWEPE